MSTAEPIDLETWTRRETFEYYRREVSVHLCHHRRDRRDRPRRGASTRRTQDVPRAVWAVATAVNRHREFRMALTDAGAPATWPVVHPAFTVFNAARETFAAVWAPYEADFGAFHERAADVLSDAASATEMFPMGELPPDVFDISSLPWTSFTGFSLQIDGGTRHLLPIFTIGRHTERDGRTLMPLALQVHHASADGFHAARLIGDIRALAAQPGWVG